jgi:hypothetical protein
MQENTFVTPQLNRGDTKFIIYVGEKPEKSGRPPTATAAVEIPFSGMMESDERQVSNCCHRFD